MSDAADWAVDAHALVIGISAYLHYPQVPEVVSSGARRVAEILSDPELGGYPPEQVRCLTDREATREAILEELETFSVYEPGSTLLIYFAGHGGSVPEVDEGEHSGPQTYLLPIEADPDDLETTAIAGRELSEILGRVRGNATVVFDCCHSGGLGDPSAQRALGGLDEEYCESLGARHGQVVLASARSNEKSWVGDEATVFTHHLLAALRGGAGRGRWLRVWDLFEYLQPKVTADQPDQHPVFKANLEENFEVALHLGGLEADEPLDLDDQQSYHAYVSYADREPDSSWVWDHLVPQLEDAGLSVAVSDDVEQPGVFRVVGAERGIEKSRRIVLVLSENYVEDRMAGFVDSLAQTVGVEEGLARLLPVSFAPFDAGALPARLRMLVSLDLGHPRRGRRNLNRLVSALHSPPPSAR